MGRYRIDEKYLREFPIWLDYHIDEVLEQIELLPDEERRRIIVEEEAKLDRFCKLMCTTEMNHRQAENQVYGDKSGYYKEFERLLKAKEEGADKKEEEQIRGFYPEKGLKFNKREELIATGYRRLKISPYGTGGSAYYLVKPRYNESKEHAFFCYLLESELRKKCSQVHLFITDGPDVVFKHNKKEYCIDVETGKNLTRHKEGVERKFERYSKEYHRSFIFVTSKRLKYKYQRYGVVITRSSFKRVLNRLFR